MKDLLPYTLTLRASTLSSLRHQIKATAMESLDDEGDDHHRFLSEQNIVDAMRQVDPEVNYWFERRVLECLGFKK